MIPDCTQYFFPINFALLLWPPHCSFEPFKVFWLSFRFWGQCNMKLFTCQKHFIQELWQQLPWVFLEPRTGWVCPCSSTWMLQELLLLGFSYWLRASGKWVQILPFCAFAITSSLKRAFVRLSKYILSSARCWCQGYEVRHESA